MTQNDGSSAENDGSFAFDDSSWQTSPHEPPNDQLLLHLARDHRRAVDPHDVYFLEATGETTLVRLRSSRRLRDTRALGKIVSLLAGFGVVRVHRNHAVNVRHLRAPPGSRVISKPDAPRGPRLAIPTDRH